MSSRVNNTRNIFIELRKICQHPYLAAPELDDESLAEEERHRLLTQSSGKLAFLKTLLPKLKERGHRVLLFSQFKIALDEIQNFLVGEGYNFLRIDGDVQQASRQKSIDAFNAPDSEYFIFLLTTRAGGVGINLATADTVIVYDPDFNPHQDLQAIARSHRYGQTKKVLVFKLMTKDSIEEQIVYNGKKKMVLDHLVVQNLGKENDDEDVSSMLLAGAKALYNTNADGVSASDVTYTSKQVEEMIDKVEQQAEEEAVRLEERWTKEDNMTEEEKLAVLGSKGTETMDFSFAKIWEMDKGELQEVDDDPALEEAMEDAMENTFATIWENAERAKKEALAQAALGRKERRKNIDYTLDDTTPLKKGVGRPKGSKNKDKTTGLLLNRAQSSGSEFNFEDDEISEDETINASTLPEGVEVLNNLTETAGAHHGQLKTKVREISKMERQAMRKKLEAEMALHTVMRDPTSAAGPSTSNEPILVRSGMVETPEQRAARKDAKRIAKMQRATERQMLEQQMRDAQAKLNRETLGSSALQYIPSVPGPSSWARTFEQSSVYSGPPAPTIPEPAPALNRSQNGLGPPSIIQMARDVSDTAEITKAQDIIKWLWHALQEMGLQKEVKSWGRMILPEVSVSERKGIYWKLAREVDKLLVEAGHASYFSEPQHRPSLEALFNSRAPGLPEGPGRIVPPPPVGVGRLVNRQSNRETSFNHGNKGGNGDGAVQSTANLERIGGSSAIKQVNSAPMSATGTRVDKDVPSSQPLLLMTPQQIAKQARMSRNTESSIGVGVRSVSLTPRQASSQTATPITDGAAIVGETRADAPSARAPAQTSNISARAVDGSITGLEAQAGPSQPRSAASNITAFAQGSNGTTNGMPVAASTTLLLENAGSSNRAAHPTNNPVISDAVRLHKSLLPGPIPSEANELGVIIEPPQAMNTLTPAEQANFCGLCLQVGHRAPRCPPSITPADKKLKNLMQITLTEFRSPGLSADKRFMAFREYNEIARRLAVRAQIAAKAAMPSAPASQPVAPAHHGPGPAAIPEPTFGLPMPKRQKTGNGVRDGQSTSSSSRAQANGTGSSRAPGSSSRTANGGFDASVRRTGTTLAEAIAIDDDDDSQSNGGPASAATASAPAPSSARAPASSSSQILPECDTCTSRDHASDSCLMLRATPVQIGRILARIPATHSKRAALQQLHDKKVADALCPMCCKACELGIRECAESNGGRKALKDRIRKLNTNGTGKGNDGEPSPIMIRLYDCYQAWPRDDTPKKKAVKQET